MQTKALAPAKIKHFLISSFKLFSFSIEISFFWFTINDLNNADFFFLTNCFTIFDKE